LGGCFSDERTRAFGKSFVFSTQREVGGKEINVKNYVSLKIRGLPPSVYTRAKRRRRRGEGADSMPFFKAGWSRRRFIFVARRERGSQLVAQKCERTTGKRRVILWKKGKIRNRLERREWMGGVLPQVVKKIQRKRKLTSIWALKRGL